MADVLRLDWAVLIKTASAIFEAALNGSLGFLPMVDLTTATGQLVANMCQTLIGGINNNGPLLQSPVAMANLTQALAVYLRTLRLRAVRNDLLEPSNQESVSAICLKWGFFHFGRFSAVYRSVYGEKPSETRNRRGSALQGDVAGR